ncbi:MAG: glycine oxidase ThiO [Byssovorax sp.]
MRDVLVIGGGVVGCAVALAALRRGLSVEVLERNEVTHVGPAPLPGPEGSAAAAGIVGAQLEGLHGDGPLSRLCLQSRDLYPRFVEGLFDLTGIDVELRPVGVSRVVTDGPALDTLLHDVAWQERAGLRVERLDAKRAREVEPALSPEVRGGVRFPDDPRIDPPKLLAAVRAAVLASGGSIRAKSPARRVLVREGKAAGVALDDGTEIFAPAVVVSAGSWSALIEESALPEGSIQPARGQILELFTDAPILRGVVEGPDCYLSPRDDGRILLGSTIEMVGYRPGATAGGASRLLAAALRLVPALEGATLRRAWAGLRPYTADEKPVIGKTEIPGLIAATGHFRNGVLLSPLTGEIVAALLTGAAPPVDLRPFLPARLAQR